MLLETRGWWTFCSSFFACSSEAGSLTDRVLGWPPGSPRDLLVSTPRALGLLGAHISHTWLLAWMLGSDHSSQAWAAISYLRVEDLETFEGWRVVSKRHCVSWVLSFKYFMMLWCFIVSLVVASKMVPWERIPFAMPDNLSSVLVIHMIERTESHKLSSNFHVCLGMQNK